MDATKTLQAQVAALEMLVRALITRDPELAAVWRHALEQQPLGIGDALLPAAWPDEQIELVLVTLRRILEGSDGPFPSDLPRGA